MRKFKECVLHIGTEKTGTSSIQSFCRSNKEMLGDLGYYYPQSLGKAGHARLAASCLNEETFGHWHCQVANSEFEEPPKFRQHLETAFKEECATQAKKSHRLLISSEFLHSWLVAKEEKQRLRDFLVPYTDHIRVVVYLRRQDQLVCSLLSTRIKGGHTSPNDVPLLSTCPQQYYNYQVLLEGYAELFGLENITVRIFEEDYLYQGDAVKDFLHVIGCPIDTMPAFPVRENKSLQYIALKFLAEFNKTHPLFINGKQNVLRGDIVMLLEKYYSGETGSITRDQARQFYESFWESNHWVQQQFFPERSVLFSEDFSDYQTALTEPTVNEMIQLFSVLWREKQFALHLQ